MGRISAPTMQVLHRRNLSFRPFPTSMPCSHPWASTSGRSSTSSPTKPAKVVTRVGACRSLPRNRKSTGWLYSCSALTMRPPSPSVSPMLPETQTRSATQSNGRQPNTACGSTSFTSTVLPALPFFSRKETAVAVTPVSSATQSSSTSDSAYGLNFQSLLQIVLEELTYQDPLNPVSNYEFVSQLGQFSQLQLSQTLNDDMTQLLSTQG